MKDPAKYSYDKYEDEEGYGVPKRRTFQTLDSCVDEDMITANALSFGGISSSCVVQNKSRTSRSREKKGGPPPPPPYGDAATGRKKPPPPEAVGRKGPPPLPHPPEVFGNADGNLNIRSSSRRGSVQAHEATSDDKNGALGYMGKNVASTVGQAMEDKVRRESMKMDSFSGSEFDPDSSEEEEVQINMKEEDQLQGMMGYSRTTAKACDIEKMKTAWSADRFAEKAVARINSKNLELIPTARTVDKAAAKMNSLDKVVAARSVENRDKPRSKGKVSAKIKSLEEVTAAARKSAPPPPPQPLLETYTDSRRMEEQQKEAIVINDPPPSSQAPSPSNQSPQRVPDTQQGGGESGGGDNDPLTSDTIGYVGTQRHTTPVRNGKGADPRLSTESFSMGEKTQQQGGRTGGRSASTPPMRQSMKKAYSTAFRSDFSRGAPENGYPQDNEGDAESRRSDPSTVRSDGGDRRKTSRRRKARSHSRHHSSSLTKREEKSSRYISAVEKLKLVHTKLEGSEGNGRRGTFQNKEFIDLLESSIRDIQRMQKAVGTDEYGDEDSYRYDKKVSNGGLSEKSPSQRSHRSHRSRGRSIGGQSKGSHSNNGESTGRRSRGSKSSRKENKKVRRSGKSRGSSRDWEGIASGGSTTASSSGDAVPLAPVPKEARKLLSRVRGSEALPRETVVSSVVRRLVSKIDREVASAGVGGDGDDGGACCVAILSSPGQNGEQIVGGGGGEGKSTIAALACVRGDVRTRYHGGIAWLNMQRRNEDDDPHRPPPGGSRLDFESYGSYLSDICRQIDVKPQQLQLSPVVRTPGEDGAISELRKRGHMRDAYVRMGKLLTTLQHQSQKGRNSKRHNHQQHTNVLVVLDDIFTREDIEWFQFRRGGGGVENGDDGVGGDGPGGGGERINDILVTSRLTEMNGVSGATTLVVPPLETKEAVRLLMTESDLLSNHPIAKNRVARVLVKECLLLHPLTIKFAGRWLSLKRATSGGQKGIDEILGEIKDATEGVAGKNNADVLYSMLNRAMSPLIKGKETKIIRLCFAALVTVFYRESCSALVPLEIANDLFLKVVENEKDILSKEDTLFQSNGRQAAKLVPEILGALGIFNITKHTTQAKGSKKNESSIQIDHDLIRHFSDYICNDENMHNLVRNAEQHWNEAYVQSYFQKKATQLWDDIQPDRSRKYALEKMPTHIIQAEMFDDAETLLQNQSFIRGRFWSLGWTEGTRAHVNDAEAFCHRIQESSHLSDGSEDCSLKLVEAYKHLEDILMEEVARESGGPIGRCSTLEAGRCLHEISVSLARFQLWDEASRFCDSCVELVESNLGPSELVASLLFNSSIMHVEANEFDLAEKIIGDCLDVRVKTSGTESILYVRALCQLGDILSMSSDYSAAESCFNKSIGILKSLPSRYHLDYGVALYKLGRNQHRRGGYSSEALHYYEEALEFEKDQLGPHHIFMSNIFTHMGEILLDREDIDQAKHTFKEALGVLTEVDPSPTLSSFELKIKFAVVGGKMLSIAGQSDGCIEKYQHALTLLQKYTPARKRKIAQVSSMIAEEYEKQGKYHAAETLYEESLNLMKSLFGPSHLDIAETLVNLSGVKSALGVEKGSPTLHCEHFAQATQCLEESIDIQKSRLGDCEECAITLTIYGAHLKTIGDFKKSELAHNDAMRILKTLEGDQDLSIMDSLLGMADLMTAMSKYDDSMEYYTQCLEIQESVFGEKHDDIASTLYAMGTMKHNAGEYPNALILLAKSLVMRVELHGEAHPAVADVYDMMGFVEAKKGDMDTALRRLKDGLEVRKSLGDQLKEADTLINIGNLYRERNDFDLALQTYDECMDIRTSELGRFNPSVADTLMSLGNVHAHMGYHGKALSFYREALEILLSVKGPNDASVALVFEKIGMVQFNAGNLESGRLFLEKAVELYRQSRDDSESDLITPLFIIGNIHDILEEAEEAQRVWNDAFEMSTTIGEQKNPEVHHVLLQLLHAH